MYMYVCCNGCTMQKSVIRLCTASVLERYTHNIHSYTVLKTKQEISAIQFYTGNQCPLQIKTYVHNGNLRPLVTRLYMCICPISSQ